MNIEPIAQLSGEASIKRRDGAETQTNIREGVQKNIEEPQKQETKAKMENLRAVEESAKNESRVSESDLEEGRAEIEKTVEDMNSFLKSQRKTLSFFVDKDSGRYGVKVVDSKTNEIVKQIPPDEVLDIAAKIKDMIGALIDKTV